MAPSTKKNQKPEKETCLQLRYGQRVVCRRSGSSLRCVGSEREKLWRDYGGRFCLEVSDDWGSKGGGSVFVCDCISRWTSNAGM